MDWIKPVVIDYLWHQVVPVAEHFCLHGYHFEMDDWTNKELSEGN